jgi:N-acetylmuramoyl-L-alanine amidase
VKLICVDAGHGGKDTGATGYDLYEKNVTLRLTKLLNDELEKYQVAATFTRYDDDYKSLEERCDWANRKGADFFISLHCNSYEDSSVGGFESYVLRNAYDSTLAKQTAIHSSVMSYLDDYNIRDRGKKEAGFYVLKYTDMPAILLENLCITNRRENELLKDCDFLRGLAQAIARGLAKALNLSLD